LKKARIIGGLGGQEEGVKKVVRILVLRTSSLKGDKEKRKQKRREGMTLQKRWLAFPLAFF